MVCLFVSITHTKQNDISNLRGRSPKFEQSVAITINIYNKKHLINENEFIDFHKIFL